MIGFQQRRERSSSRSRRVITRSGARSLHSTTSSTRSSVDRRRRATGATRCGRTSSPASRRCCGCSATCRCVQQVLQNIHRCVQQVLQTIHRCVQQVLEYIFRCVRQVFEYMNRCVLQVFEYMNRCVLWVFEYMSRCVRQSLVRTCPWRVKVLMNLVAFCLPWSISGVCFRWPAKFFDFDH